MSAETEQLLRDWLTDRAGSDAPDRLAQRVRALPGSHPTRRIRLEMAALPFPRRPAGASIAAVTAIAMVILAVAMAGIVLRHPDASTSEDRMVAAPRETTAASSPMRVGPIPTVAPSPQVSAGLAFLRRAWRDLQRTRGDVPTEETIALEAFLRTELDQLYRARVPETATLWEFAEPTDVKAMTVGPDRGVYFIAPATGGRGDSVWRLDRARKRVYEIIRTGDPRVSGKREMARPRLLAMTALDSPELLVVDDAGQLWRWAQYGDKADGTLSYRRVGGDVRWGDDVRDITTLVTSASQGHYNLYVLDADSDRILKYAPWLTDSSRFGEPEDYLVLADESVADYIRLYIGDGNLYTLTPDNVVKHNAGRRLTWGLDDPPDNGDLRPGHRYRLIDGARPERLFVYDELWNRILVFTRSDGSYVEQWATRGPLPPMDDVRGMYVTQSGTAQEPKAPVVIWATPQGIYRSTLVEAGADLTLGP